MLRRLRKHPATLMCAHRCQVPGITGWTDIGTWLVDGTRGSAATGCARRTQACIGLLRGTPPGDSSWASGVAAIATSTVDLTATTIGPRLPGRATGLPHKVDPDSGTATIAETVQEMLKHYDEWGGPSTYPHMAAGWAVAGDTPFMWTKQIPSNYGGTRNGMIVSWPRGIKAKNEVRSQWHHVIDIAPTVLEAAKLPEPRSVNGTVQSPIEGVSMAYSFDKPDAASTHKTQYFEITGNRAIYNEGWFAGTIHRAPWEQLPRHKLQEDILELYDTRADFSLANDVAAANPAKLEELQDVFMKEATKYRVLPIDDRSIERLNPASAGRPDLMGNRTSLTLAEGMVGMSENVFINIKNRSFSITAEVNLPEGGANGVILAQGGRFGGWSLYLKDGRPTYCYNLLGLEQFKVSSSEALAAGKATIRLNFDYEGGGIGKGGTATLLANDKTVASGKIERTQAMVFSADETAGVGMDDATPVTTDYKERDNSFTGKIYKVTVDVKPIGAAVKAQAAAATQEAAIKTALSN